MLEYFQSFDFTSLSSYRFPFHIATLTFVAWNVLQADHMGFSWMRGKVALLDKDEVRKFHVRVSIGLGLMILSGLTLFWPMREYLLDRPQFYMKMTFVLGLIVNSFVISKFSSIPTTRTFASLSFNEKLPMLISGGISTLCWFGAATFAFFLLDY
jgi:hypothetical protein